jgi:uncharacterized lipoprotein YddW (UPF0748 family)
LWIARAIANASLLVPLVAMLACGGDSETPPEPEVADATNEQAQPVWQPPSVRPRGIWVLCEGSQRVLEHPDRLETLIDDARRMGVSDLFVQVYRGGRAWFDSSWAGAEPYERIRESLGIDPLAQLISRAHEAGMRVHAWVNVLSVAGNRETHIVTILGRDAVLVDRQGRSILDYPKLDIPQPDRRYYRMGTPAIFLDPATPGVTEYIAGTFAELVERYPGLDGLHLDYIRYPGVLPFSPGSRFGVGLDFGYGEPSRARFKTETGLTAPLGDSLRNANRWDEWRREKVTEVVRAVRDAALATRSAAPEPRAFAISAAVGTYAERMYLAEGQDWRRWLEEDLIEFAIPMSYTLDDRMFRYMAEGFASGPHADRIWLGQGTWLFNKRPAGALDQLRVARTAGTAGEVLFSYDSIADTPALRDALLVDVPGEPAGGD